VNAANVATLGTMAKPKLKKRLVVRIAAPLIAKLKTCAERDGRPLSSYVRKVLADAAASARP
jgi:predicted DNA binding CopG/RHH family protein